MYLFDTYAIFELLAGNPAYKRFTDGHITTTTLNLAELYYWLLLRKGKREAQDIVRRLRFEFIDVEQQDMLTAMEFRHLHRGRKMSTINCIGYAVATRHNLRFLTGDKQFERIANVEFVK